MSDYDTIDRLRAEVDRMREERDRAQKELCTEQALRCAVAEDRDKARESAGHLSNQATEWREQVASLVEGLRTMATMACQHSPPCDKKNLDRGGCCNSCWARRFALKALKRLGKGTGEDNVCPECGAVHLPGQNTLCTR